MYKNDLIRKIRLISKLWHHNLVNQYLQYTYYTISQYHSISVIFDISLESLGGNPLLKKKPIAKLIQIKEKIDLCDIWRIRNHKIKCFTFSKISVNRLRKFNNSLSMNFDFQIKIKFHTKSTLETLEIERSKKVLDSSQKIRKKHKLHWKFGIYRLQK